MLDLNDREAMEALARGLKEGEPRAIHAFLDTFGRAIRRMFLRAGLRPVDAEDLAHNCVTDIAISVHRYTARPNGSFAAWALTIARNRCVSFQRQRHDREVPLEADVAVTSLGEVEDLLVAETSRGIVQDALARLSPSEREILSLRGDDDEDSFLKIAARLRISVSAARQRYHRARMRLQDVLRSDPRAMELAGEISGRH